MSPLAILQDIVTVAYTIYSRVQLTKGNQKKLATLDRTVQITVSALKRLSDLPNTESFLDSLIEFKARVLHTSEVVTEIANMSYMMSFINAGSNQHRIDSCRQSILEWVPMLNLGVNTQQLMNREQDRSDEAADKEHLIAYQALSLRKIQEGRKIDSDELDLIIQKQISSFQNHLEEHLDLNQTVKKLPLPERLIVNLYDIVFDEKINEDSFGAIYQGFWQDRPITIKCFDHLATDGEQIQLIRESQIMSGLHHEAIASFYGACLDPERMCLLMSIMEKGNLQTALPSLSFADRLKIVKDLACGLAYLHEKNCIIGDIHPKHIGVNQKNQAKWTNFGLAKLRFAGIATLQHRTSSEEAWQAPESWQNRAALTPASDIYSFGMLMWSLITGRTPYADIPAWDVMLLVKRGRREVIPSEVPDSYRALINACWSSNVATRPTAAQVSRTLDTIDEAEFFTCSPTGQEYYEQGMKAEKTGSMNEAYELYKRASEKNYYKSFTSLALFSLQGLGGRRVDKAQAESYLERAAAGGHGRAMFNLGRMAEKGDNETQTPDLERAFFWYEKAFEANPKDLRAKEKLKKLNNKHLQPGV